MEMNQITMCCFSMHMYQKRYGKYNIIYRRLLRMNMVLQVISLENSFHQHTLSICLVVVLVVAYDNTLTLHLSKKLLTIYQPTLLPCTVNTFNQYTERGLAGNEDAGQMSAWLVLSSIGFYQVCPGCGGANEYILGLPQFAHTEISLPSSDSR